MTRFVSKIRMYTLLAAEPASLVSLPVSPKEGTEESIVRRLISPCQAMGRNEHLTDSSALHSFRRTKAVVSDVLPAPPQ
jgi:hypothetical protein